MKLYKKKIEFNEANTLTKMKRCYGGDKKRKKKNYVAWLVSTCHLKKILIMMKKKGKEKFVTITVGETRVKG